MTSKFKIMYNFEERVKEFHKIQKSHPNHVPIIIEKNPNSKINEIEKFKYLVPQDQTIGQFIYIIRKRIKINENESIFVFVKNILPRTSDMLKTIYEAHKDTDGFLYLLYSGENTFGKIKL